MVEIVGWAEAETKPIIGVLTVIDGLRFAQPILLAEDRVFRKCIDILGVARYVWPRRH